MHSFRQVSESTESAYSIGNSCGQAFHIPADWPAWCLTASLSLLKALSSGPTSFVDSVLAKRRWKGVRSAEARLPKSWEAHITVGRGSMLAVLFDRVHALVIETIGLLECRRFEGLRKS